MARALPDILLGQLIHFWKGVKINLGSPPSPPWKGVFFWDFVPNLEKWCKPRIYDHKSKENGVKHVQMTNECKFTHCEFEFKLKQIWGDFTLWKLDFLVKISMF